MTFSVLVIIIHFTSFKIALENGFVITCYLLQQHGISSFPPWDSYSIQSWTWYISSRSDTFLFPWSVVFSYLISLPFQYWSDYLTTEFNNKTVTLKVKTNQKLWKLESPPLPVFPTHDLIADIPANRWFCVPCKEGLGSCRPPNWGSAKAGDLVAEMTARLSRCITEDDSSHVLACAWRGPRGCVWPCIHFTQSQ